MLSDSDLDELVKKAVLLYNRLRRPETNVKLVTFSPPRLTVSFTGGFCYNCGVQQYVEGFSNQFKALTTDAELKLARMREIRSGMFEADYTIKMRLR